MIKKTIIETEKVDTLQGFNALFAMMLECPEIKAFLEDNKEKLFNKTLFDNSCYQIVTDGNKTIVYLNM